MITVYVLLSAKDSNFYVGMTNNLTKRIHDHNSAKVRSTKSRTPFSLLYSEEHSNRKIARAREKYLKSSAGKRYLQKFFAQQQPSHLPD
ncbi:MAG: GIY-YIG nuclease family protein [Bacteroidota bacterium]